MLDGVRVLDLASLAAAPLVATYLGEFGADVIKGEEPKNGDPIRGWGNQRDGVGLMDEVDVDAIANDGSVVHGFLEDGAD